MNEVTIDCVKIQQRRVLARAREQSADVLRGGALRTRVCRRQRREMARPQDREHDAVDYIIGGMPHTKSTAERATVLMPQGVMRVAQKTSAAYSA